jgi:hypothetical protein
VTGFRRMVPPGGSAGRFRGGYGSGRISKVWVAIYGDNSSRASAPADRGRGPAERREHTAKLECEAQAQESGLGVLGGPRPSVDKPPERAFPRAKPGRGSDRGRPSAAVSCADAAVIAALGRVAA